MCSYEGLGALVVICEGGFAMFADGAALTEERYWNVKDFARVFGVSRTWVYDQVALGRIPHNRMGGLIRFNPAAIRAWMKAQAVEPREPNAP